MKDDDFGALFLLTTPVPGNEVYVQIAGLGASPISAEGNQSLLAAIGALLNCMGHLPNPVKPNEEFARRVKVLFWNEPTKHLRVQILG
ncbi:MAG: hypothetical protein AAB511_02465 [Patescibacteria group bacterium]